MRIHMTRILKTVSVAVFAVAGVTYVGTAAETSQAPAATPSVQPTVVDDNPSCTDLGFDFGYKIDSGPFNGSFTSGDGALTVDLISGDGVSFEWSSDIGIDAVIVKGGPNANVYVYDPPAESYGDAGLTPPVNPNNGTPYAISHIEFCYDFELTVSKDATTEFTRTYLWDIDKGVTPESWDLFTGDTGTSEYTVRVDRQGYTDSDWMVSGTIAVANDTPYDAVVTGLTDVVSDLIIADVNCPITFPHLLAPGSSLSCTYEAPLPDGTDRVNTATAITAEGIVGNGTGTADVTFGEPTKVVDDTVTVTDTNGEAWVFSDDGAVSYSRTFDCDDEGTNTNTATIVETGQSDDATVTVACYDLTVTKSAETSYDRAWTWTIDKTANQSELTLSEGQQFPVDYQVTVDATSVDSAFAVAGEITITNPHPTRDAVLTGVTDLVSPDIAATVSCPGSTVPAGGSLTCGYTSALPDATARVNVATATLQNHDFAADSTATASGTTDVSSDPVDVVFGVSPTQEFDECIDVTDTYLGDLGTVCVGSDVLPLTFVYSRSVGPYDTCGEFTVDNTASFVTNDTAATGEDSWTVDVTVPCEGGCTLTPGYWKTHSEYGPAPYDDTLALLSDGADTPFLGTGSTYYEVLNTPPTGGNAYLILAHAYIAAELNVLNGASIPPDVLASWNQATTLLETYETDVDIPKREKADRAFAISLATILDDYNNGLTGPGHCSE
jgi:hypothetical protein